jgi:hypothetical protein
MRTLTIVKTDFKNIFRDPSLVMIFIAPIAILAVLRFVPPLIESFFPIVYEYRPLILGTFSLLMATLASFLLTFVMLDEKDQELFHVFRIMPFTFPRLILLRIMTMMATGFIFCLLLIIFSGLVIMKVPQIIVLALLSSLSGPADALLIVSIANNKIEGATYFKALNMFIMAPLAGVFIAGPLKYLLGIFPFFWVFMSFMEYASPTSFYLHAGIGFISHLAYLVFTFYLFLRRNS